MKATIDIPDDLYRKAEAKSAREGRPLGEIAVELLDHWVSEGAAHGKDAPSVSVGELMTDLCGSIDSGVTDLSTYPAYLEELGRASTRDR